MSRVYSALTGTTRPAGAAVLDAPDDGVWENSEEPAAEVAVGDHAHFIEIARPAARSSAGTHSSSATCSARRRPRRRPRRTEPARTFPRLAPATSTAYLSVRFHDVVAARTILNNGPDASSSRSTFRTTQSAANTGLCATICKQLRT